MKRGQLGLGLMGIQFPYYIKFPSITKRFKRLSIPMMMKLLSWHPRLKYPALDLAWFDNDYLLLNITIVCWLLWKGLLALVYWFIFKLKLAYTSSFTLKYTAHIYILQWTAYCFIAVYTLQCTLYFILAVYTQWMVYKQCIHCSGPGIVSQQWINCTAQYLISLYTAAKSLLYCISVYTAMNSVLYHIS